MNVSKYQSKCSNIICNVCVFLNSCLFITYTVRSDNRYFFYTLKTVCALHVLKKKILHLKLYR